MPLSHSIRVVCLNTTVVHATASCCVGTRASDSNRWMDGWLDGMGRSASRASRAARAGVFHYSLAVYAV